MSGIIKIILCFHHSGYYGENVLGRGRDRVGWIKAGVAKVKVIVIIQAGEIISVTWGDGDGEKWRVLGVI